MTQQYTNGYFIFDLIAEHGEYLWVLPVDMHPSQLNKGRPNKDIPLFNQLLHEGPLTFRKGTLDVV